MPIGELRSQASVAPTRWRDFSFDLGQRFSLCCHARVAQLAGWESQLQETYRRLLKVLDVMDYVC